jgi:hypothetical protein
MTITVASYLMGIPPGNTNPEKPQIIVNFIEGVWASGDKGTIVCDYDPIDCDVAVVQGFVHPGSKHSTHLNLRKSVFDKQNKDGKRSIIVDSNLFLSYDLGNKNKFLRYSYDGIFPTTGEYCNDAPHPERWDILSKKLNISLKPWRKAGNEILLCCQRDGGWSMDGQALMPWIINTVKEIRKYSERKIVIRFHPGDKNSLSHRRALSRFKLKNVSLSNNKNLLDDLKTAHALVNHNSSPGVVAAIEGVPVFLTDPIRSQAKDVAHHSFEHIENIQEFDREKWVQKMAQMHWTLDELKDGTAWRHLRQWAKK